MPRPDSDLHFLVKMALRKALKLVRGLRKQITELDEDVMASKLIEEINRSAYEITRKPGPPVGFTFEPPEGPRS